jgi:hypothetical protein
MLEIVTCEMTININVLSVFLKNKAAGNLNDTIIITIYRSWFSLERGNPYQNVTNRT